MRNCRREVSELMHEAEEAADENGALDAAGKSLAETLPPDGAVRSSAAVS